MRCFLLVTAAVILLFFCNDSVYAQETEEISEAELTQWLEESGAMDLPEQLPEATQSALSEIGVYGIDPEQISSVSPGAIFGGIWQQLRFYLPEIMGFLFRITALIFLCAIVHSMGFSVNHFQLDSVVVFICTVSVLTMAIPHIIGCMQQAANMLQIGSVFLLSCVPILVGFLFAAGKGASGAACGGLVLSFCNVISFVASNWILPVLNILLGFTAVSVLSPDLNLNGICKCCFSVIKWILGIGMTLFSALISMQSLLGNGLTATTNRTVKYMVSSFVPIVGNALGEAFGTIHNCANYLRTGVGAFGVLGILFLFLPPILQCLLWNGALHLAAAVGDLLALKQVSALLRGIGKVLSVLIALLLCSLAMLIVSLEILMRMGGETL